METERKNLKSNGERESEGGRRITVIPKLRSKSGEALVKDDKSVGQRRVAVRRNLRQEEG